MQREELNRKASERVQVSKQGTGAESPVVALSPVKAGGAKGRHCPVVFAGQPEVGGACEYGKAVCHLKGDGVGSL